MSGSELITRIGHWGPKSAKDKHYTTATSPSLMYFLAHLGKREVLRGLTDGQLVGRSLSGEAWIREHHEVGDPWGLTDI